jgi:L-cystine uptake protein TcyP (sodium:dicarboxylate symporter family)
MDRSGAAGKISLVLLATMLGLMVLQGYALPRATWILALVPLLWLSSMGVAIWAAVEGRGRRFAVATLVIAVGLIALWIALTPIPHGPPPMPQ